MHSAVDRKQLHTDGADLMASDVRKQTSDANSSVNAGTTIILTSHISKKSTLYKQFSII